MAQVQEVRLVDDLDGGPAKETVRFGLDKNQYEIDLSPANAAKLRDTIATFVGAARRAGDGRRRASRRTSSPNAGAAVDREQNTAIRDWAKSKGMKVAERGRIPQRITDAYHAER